MDEPSLLTSLVMVFLPLHANSIARSPRSSKKHPRYTAPGMRGGAAVLDPGDGAGVLSLSVGAGVLGLRGRAGVSPHASKGSNSPPWSPAEKLYCEQGLRLVNDGAVRWAGEGDFSFEL